MAEGQVDRLNKKQRIVVWIAIAMAVAMFLYPPVFDSGIASGSDGLSGLRELSRPRTVRQSSHQARSVRSGRQSRGQSVADQPNELKSSGYRPIWNESAGLNYPRLAVQFLLLAVAAVAVATSLRTDRISTDGRNVSVRRGLPVLNAVAIDMLIAAVYGDPSYGFFLALKWVVAGACALNAWQLYVARPGYIAVSWLLVASGGVQAFGEMRRDEWPLFNWASLLLLTVSGVVLLSTLRGSERHRDKAK